MRSHHSSPTNSRHLGLACKIACGKVEGVFLWVQLTVNPVNKAIYQDKTVQDLKHRVDSLPEDLNLLFSDMWNRMTKDSPHLRPRATTYLQLTLAHSKISLPWMPPNVFSMMVAATAGMSDQIHGQSRLSPMSARYLQEACEHIMQDVEVRCARLVVRERMGVFKISEEVDWNKVPDTSLLVHLPESSDEEDEGDKEENKEA
ncbi:hypothetical protein PspLS_01867 [Pyricularia sp. CBS 133598]|nr:hypothetical protein PspLS_01867 [Pyricularia sp. CBS 133598]